MSLASILGQNKAITLLTRAITSGRLAHAYLFAGPDGVGKTTAARALAAVLLCRQPEGLSPCGHCPGCVKFASGNHPDLMVIRPDGAAIKIDQIREMKKALTFSPFESQQRVVLIEDVHTMRREAGNSLLKILEEPPPNNLLILIGATAGGLLDTIISRCQVIPFSPLPLDVAARIISTHQPELSQEDCRTLAAFSDGCPGQALALESEGTLPLYSELLKCWLAPAPSRGKRVEQALTIAMTLADAKESLEPLLMLLRIFIKDAMAARTNSGVSTFSPEVLQARERWNLERLSAKMSAIDLAEQALARNCNRGLTCEVLLLDLFDLNS